MLVGFVENHLVDIVAVFAAEMSGRGIRTMGVRDAAAEGAD